MKFTEHEEDKENVIKIPKCEESREVRGKLENVFPKKSDTISVLHKRMNREIDQLGRRSSEQK